MKNSRIIIVFSLLLAFAPFYSFASTSTDAVMSESTDVTLTEGKVKRYNQETQILVLQSKNGEKITIALDWNTILIGYSTPNEIEKGHKVKIWHSNNTNNTTAVKIEKKLILGC
jgi:hypothetical protein